MMESTILSVTNDEGDVVDVNKSMHDLTKAKDIRVGANASSRPVQQSTTAKSASTSQSKHPAN